MPTVDGLWTLVPVRRMTARLRLVCIPAAGSGPGMFRRWPVLMGAGVEVVLVQLPGRERRVGEPPLVDYRDATEALARHLRGIAAGPYALLGHSMGGLLALGVAARLAAAGRPPHRLIVSGCPAPGSVAAPPASADDSDAHLIARLRAFGGTDPAVFEAPGLLELVLPIYRADLRICASFRPPDGPLPVPLVAYGGGDDFAVEHLRGWARWSAAGAGIRVFPGGHFFVNGEAEAAVVEAIGHDLVRPIGAAG